MSGAPLPRSLERLIEALSRLPGVGPRTAERLAFHILRTPLADAQALAGCDQRRCASRRDPARSAAMLPTRCAAASARDDSRDTEHSSASSRSRST